MRLVHAGDPAAAGISTGQAVVVAPGGIRAIAAAVRERLAGQEAAAAGAAGQD
jgi:hypothetical protein